MSLPVMPVLVVDVQKFTKKATDGFISNPSFHGCIQSFK